MNKLFLLFVMAVWVTHSQAQSFSSKSNAMALDYSDPNKNFTTTLPKITPAATLCPSSAIPSQLAT